MPVKPDWFRDFVLDQLRHLRGVTCRAMFGGYGLYHDTTFFGVVHRGRLFFKVSPATAAQYRARGMTPFRPRRSVTLRTYYEVPPDILEDPDQLAAWANDAVRSQPGRRRVAGARAW